jgi:hypothetical protein
MVFEVLTFGLTDRRTGYVCFELRNVPARPTHAATMPPINIQTALSVGEPVKNRETSELKEFVALMPMIMSTTPPMSRAREIILFIKPPFKKFVICCHVIRVLHFPSRSLASGNEVGEHHDNGDHQQDVNEPAHR